MGRDNKEDLSGTPVTGVAAVDRALSIMAVFTANDPSLTLAEISARTGIYKSTILRLCQSLTRARLLLRLEDGRFRIGSEALRLGTIYQEVNNLRDILLPRLSQLAKATGESVVYYEREGDVRVCRMRIESEQPIRHHVREGERLPLGLGSPGRVIMAFSGEPGEPFENIRRDYFYISLGERAKDTAAVAAPLFGPNQTLVGSICVSGPSSRLVASSVKKMVPLLLKTAQAVTQDLGGNQAVFDRPIAKAPSK